MKNISAISPTLVIVIAYLTFSSDSFAQTLPSTAIEAPTPTTEPAPATPAYTVTGNVALASQYVFRGLTQTNGKPAVQVGLDYAHGSGWYAGTWMSNISWYDQQNAGTVSKPVALGSPGSLGLPYQPNKTNATSLEWDIYGGYKTTFATDGSLDLGVIRYLYPGHYDNVGAYRRPETTEVYVAIGYQWVTLKYSKAISTNTFGAAESHGASYVDLSVNLPIGESGYTVVAHAGYQSYAGKANPGYWGTSGGSNKDYDYRDYKLGVARDIGGFNFALNASFAKTRSYGPDGQTTAYFNAYGNNIGRGRIALVATRNF